MTTSILRLDILQPGERADEILSAVAAVFGYEWSGPDPEGRASFMVPMAFPLARQRAAKVIADQGDDGQMIVRVP